MDAGSEARLFDVWPAGDLLPNWQNLWIHGAAAVIALMKRLA